MTLTAPPEPGPPHTEPQPARRRRRTRRAPASVAGRAGSVLLSVSLACLLAALVAGLLAGPLWLDESLSVAIARLPLLSLDPDSLYGGLKQDGAPPLYYLLLRAWTELFGTGTVAVRLLSVLVVGVALLLGHRLGQRYGGAAGARAAVIVLAAMPWTMRYGTETRMYLLVAVLVLAGLLVLPAVRHGRGAAGVLVGAGIGALLLYTHYWSLFLLAAVAAVHLPALRRGAPEARRVFLAVLGAGIAFLPWAPTFLFQSRRTGAPWADPLGIAELLRTPRYFGGGTTSWRTAFGVLVVLLVAVAVVRRPAWRAAATVVGLTLGVAFTLVYVGGGAYADRYFAVVVPIVALLMAAGALALGGRATLAALALVVVIGGVSGVLSAFAPRTEAAALVEAYRAGAQPGDLLASCPDQLAPDVARLLGPDVPQRVYPTLGPPQRIDWIDYAGRQAAADPAAVARRLSALAGDRPMYLQTAAGYQTFGTSCERLRAELINLRGPSTLLLGNAGTETRLLHRFDAPRTGRSGTP